jgi:putative endonuclease
MDSKELGVYGEKIAKNFFSKKGLDFIMQNFHAQGGELDLVFYDKKNEEFVFIEVKTRRNEKFGDALTSITKSKIKKMCLAINKFFIKQGFELIPDFRIDALILRFREGKFFAEHIENIGFDDF